MRLKVRRNKIISYIKNQIIIDVINHRRPFENDRWKQRVIKNRFTFVTVLLFVIMRMNSIMMSLVKFRHMNVTELKTVIIMTDLRK